MADSAISLAAEYGKDAVVGRIRRAVGDAGYILHLESIEILG